MIESDAAETGFATAAGLGGFAFGTATQGSIVSPATRTGVTGLRPTFGRVPRTGAMALSGNMAKDQADVTNGKDCAIVTNHQSITCR